MNCIICGKKIYGSGKKFCSLECKNIQQKKIKDEIRQKNEDTIINGIEFVDYIKCKWCGMLVKRVYGQHIKNHHIDKTSDDYKKEFPGALLTCSKDKELTSKNSGQFMKLDKYRKKYSELIKGDKNPNHKSKTTEEERKARSPFTNEFYMSRGYNENESETLKRNLQLTAAKDRISTMHYQYWLNKCNGDNIEATKLYKNRQATFTLKKCIDKYGFAAGTQKWNMRQLNWKNKVFNATTCISSGVSKMSLTLMLELEKTFPTLLFGNNEKYICNMLTLKRYKYDATYMQTKKIIEFNGVFWHCKPDLYDSNYYHKIKKKYAKDIWEEDNQKKITAEIYGYKVFVVWEDEYFKDPKNTIKKCIEFLNEKTT